MLVSHHLCPYVQRAAITLTEKNIEHERVSIDLSNKPDWFLEISPMGRVPVLKTGESVLFESAVICEYLEEVTPGALHPEDALAKAHHRSWIEFGSSILDAIGGFYNAKDAETFEAKRQVLRGKFEWLESNLCDGPYFDGEKFHLVDAVYGPVFRYLDTFDKIGDFGLLKGLERTKKYRKALSERPSVRAAVAPEYPEMLASFLERRNSHISSLMREAA